MVKDKKEQHRKLSPTEQRRLQHFQSLSERLEAQGYQRKELTVGIVAANVFAVLLGIPVIIVGLILFFLRHAEHLGSAISLMGRASLLLVVVFFALIVVHEGIHGLTWSIFAENHLKDIEFVFMKEYLTPYCTCKCPLSKGKYIIGALMPLIILGIIPMAVGIAAGSMLLLLIGIIMVLSAGGDIMIVMNIMKYKSRSEDVLYLDHPTQAGGVIFEKM